MIISDTKDFVFLAYWKTGSTSIEDALRSYANINQLRWLRIKYKILYRGRGAAFKHMPARRCLRLLGRNKWRRHFSFAFARNPWDRAVSGYVRHFHQADRDMREGFNAFIKAGARPWIKNRQFFDFVSDDEGNIIVDFVGRVENLQEDFRAICDKVGIDTVELPHLNKSWNRTHYREYYTEETRRIVAEWARRDIDLLEYEF